ncbi:MAG TPA: L-threonylcarbamoyladenylate synthase [Gaiellaceae bacterium]|nr:L-threonylcarbamoyladenylate synthase [Gaiellaceae bacterium]
MDAVAALRAGQPVVLPTDTVYGLCADAESEDACRRALALKGRPEDQPAALLCADVEALLVRVPELPAGVVRALLPGALTLVFANPARRYPWLAEETIGVRVPQLPEPTSHVLRAVGAVMATSANVHAGPDPRRLEDVPKEIRAACGALVDEGELPGVPSTVLDLTGVKPRVLREGAVPAREALARVAAVRPA